MRQALVSPAYRSPVIDALVIQTITTAWLVTVLDGGTLARAGAAAMIGFWGGVAIVMARRPFTPGRLDLAYVRWGSLPVLAIGRSLVPYLGVLR